MSEKGNKAVNEISKKASECPVTKVTVYKDRAEVCRQLETAVVAGVNELHIKEFVSIEEDSIRVEGQGNATIAEVSYQHKFVAEDEATTTDKVKKLKDELRHLEDLKKTLDFDAKLAALIKQWSILDNFAATAAKHGQGEDSEDKKNFKLDNGYFTGMREFLQQYKDIGIQLEAERLDLENKNEDLTKKIETVERNLQEASICYGGHENRECVVVLEAEKETTVQLTVTYVVWGASWSPVYDLRMLTEQGDLKIFYYGLIRQNSGEDWNDVKLFLSTAEPSVGGTIPTLPATQLAVKKIRPPAPRPEQFLRTAVMSKKSSAPPATMAYSMAPAVERAAIFHTPVQDFSRPYVAGLAKEAKNSNTATFKACHKRRLREKAKRVVKAKHLTFGAQRSEVNTDRACADIIADEVYDDGVPQCVMYSAPIPVAIMPVPEVQVTESTTSTTYEIARLSTVPSDYTEHKVTVAIIDLKPTLTYVTVPKVVPHAFLQAKVINTSQYTLLSGRTNIFLDNSFVAKAEINSVAPKEEFECSLGVDPGLRVDYKPVVKVNSSSGIISKTQCITHEQAIEIKNIHDYNVKVLIRDNLPRSLDEKIKVNLISPFIDAKHPEKTESVRLAKNNNVEWDLEIKGLDKVEVVLKYTVEHPAAEEIEATTSIGN